MTMQETATSPSTCRPAVANVSGSLAHVDRALLLGGGLGTGLTIVAMRRARSATPLLVTGTMVAAALILALRLGRRSGATTAELRRALPGDDLIPRPRLVTDRALTIHAPAAEIWPWIVQMGYHRGGWYTNQRLDTLLWHIENPSVDHIVPEFQHLQVGDVVPDGPPGTAFFRVAAVEPGRALILLDDGGTHVPGTAFSWAFVLEPLTEHSTRVQVRTRSMYAPSLLWTLLSRLIVGPADYVAAVTGRDGDDAAAGAPASQALLERLERASLFHIALDDDRQWYRYYRLFAEVLRLRPRRTQPDRLPELHRRADAWLEQQGLVAEAAQHAPAVAEREHAAGRFQAVGGRQEAVGGARERLSPIACRLPPIAYLAGGGE